MMCASCDWKVDKPECPACSAFLPRTYLHHRSVYADQIVTQLGLSLTELKANPEKTLRTIKERAGRDFEALIDEFMTVAGEEVVERFLNSFELDKVKNVGSGRWPRVPSKHSVSAARLC